MNKYEIISIETLDGKVEERIIRNDGDGLITHIPSDPSNSDYQRYLRWLNGEEEGSLI